MYCDANAVLQRENFVPKYMSNPTNNFTALGVPFSRFLTRTSSTASVDARNRAAILTAAPLMFLLGSQLLYLMHVEACDDTLTWCDDRLVRVYLAGIRRNLS